MIPAIHLTDAYKTGHIFQYPKCTTQVYSNLTARTSRMPGIDAVVVFGIQYVLKEYLVSQFNVGFFHIPKNVAVQRYKRRLDNALGKGAVSMDHIEALHDLGYLPVRIKALPEGTRCPIKVPFLTIVNTLPEFFWVTNFLETLLCNVLWHPITSATIAAQYRKILDEYAEATSDMPDFVKWQGHDFSMRGHTSLESSCVSGGAHLLSFTGTDTIPAIDWLERYYHANSDRELIGGSVPATEHSVMCLGGKGTEKDTYRRLITEVYPSGVVSIVSDTWDYFKVLNEIVRELKPEIMARDGKVVIRPDSGDPVKILCGDPLAPQGSLESLGTIEILWDIFGGTVNSKGYRQLDPHIGVIYGDSITLDRCQEICGTLKNMGYASTNVVFGIGSYCVAPETLILCSDLVWRTAGSLEVGQEIIAFDENPTFGAGKKVARRYKTAFIEANSKSIKDCLQVSTDIGDPVIASSDHPWLVWVKNRSRQRTRIGKLGTLKDPRTPGLEWKTTKELIPGDQIAFLSRPWHSDNTRSGGWLAGMLDGEGSLSRATGEERIPHYKIAVSQNAGPLLDRLRCEITNRGFFFYENTRLCPQLVITGGWAETLRFLGQVRPDRLIAKLPEVLKGLPGLFRGKTYTLATVASIDKIGNHPVSSITTSSGTFITAGYLTHNTYQHVTRDTFGFAMKATAGIIDGSPVSISKDPVTDNGIKRSAKGLLRVNRDLTLSENVTPHEENDGLLRVVFHDGLIVPGMTLQTIRETLHRGGL